MNYSGEKFLLKVYRELYNKESVKKSGTLSDTKFELVKKYLERIDNISNAFKKNRIELIKYIKNRYYDKYVVDYENIPDKYSDKKKKSIIENQKNSLDLWIDFLMNDNEYPMWLKYWTLKSITKLGKYDKEKESFSKRTKKTISSFPEFEEKVIKSLYNYVLNYINNDKGNDLELNTLINNANFSKMYAYVFKIYFNKDLDYCDGIWKKYSLLESADLVNDIKNKNTGWCITDPYEASSFLELGSLNIYFLKDNNNEYSMPRVCIRDISGEIIEIRGILSNQNVECELLDVIEKKLYDYSNYDDYTSLIIDMRHFHDIEEKCKKGFEFSREDLIFLYEIKNKISYFGRESNIDNLNILKYRNVTKDLATIFMIDEKYVGTSYDDLKNPSILCFYGDIVNKEKDVIDDIYIPKFVVGSVVFPNLKDSRALYNLEFISGRLGLYNLDDTSNLNNLRFVRDFIALGDNFNMDDLTNLDENSTLHINGCSRKKKILIRNNI